MSDHVPPPPQGPYGPPHGAAPGHPYGAAPGHPYGAAPGHPYGAAPGHPYGAAPGHPYGVPPLLTMPTAVRAAQITIWAMAGLTVLTSVLVGLADGPRSAGASAGQNLLGYVLFVLAFRYGKAGTGVRVTSIVLASLQILMALSGTVRGILGGVFALVGAIVVVILLSQGDSGRWFSRPRSPGFTA